MTRDTAHAASHFISMLFKKYRALSTCASTKLTKSRDSLLLPIMVEVRGERAPVCCKQSQPVLSPARYNSTSPALAIHLYGATTYICRSFQEQGGRQSVGDENNEECRDSSWNTTSASIQARDLSKEKRGFVLRQGESRPAVGDDKVLLLMGRPKKRR